MYLIYMGCAYTTEKETPWNDEDHWIHIARLHFRLFDHYTEPIKESIIERIRYNGICTVQR
jgi:hypothetical protein